MTEENTTPQEGIADALGGLSEQTRLLVRHEVDAAQQEMLIKAKTAAPALILLAGAGTCSLFAAASVYRFTLHVLERKLPGGTAALLAAAGYGAAAGFAAFGAARRFRSLPPLFPAETARRTGAGIAEAARPDSPR